jgi:ABC-type multidrug transport system ATPase subunit
VLISGHVLAEVSQTADRVLIISGGPLVIESSLAEPTARRRRSSRPQRRPAAAHQGAA